jgi:hypothetical protein
MLNGCTSFSPWCIPRASLVHPVYTPCTRRETVDNFRRVRLADVPGIPVGTKTSVVVCWVYGGSVGTKLGRGMAMEILMPCLWGAEGVRPVLRQ